MKIALSSLITTKFPGINFKILQIRNLNNQRKSTVTSQFLRGACAKLASDFKRAEFKDRYSAIFNETLDEHSTLFESYLLNYKIKKACAGKELDSKDNFGDVVNFLSLKNITPVFGFDLDQAETDYEIDFFETKRGKKVEDFNFTRDTVNAVIWLADLGQMEPEQFESLPYEFIKNLEKYCGAHVTEIYDLNIDQPIYDLNYISEKESQFIHKKELQVVDEEYEKSLQNDEAAEEDSSLLEPQKLDLESKSAFLKSPTIQEILHTYSVETLKLFLEELDFHLEENLESLVEIETPKDSSHGDYSTNIALKLSKKLGKNPMELAEQITAKFPLTSFVNKVECVKPGFINFHLSVDYLSGELDRLLKLGNHFGESLEGEGKRVLIEYSSPNIPKPLGVHHLITTYLGQVLVNLYRKSGYSVLSMNYPNDWGTLQGQIIYSYRTWGDKRTIEKNPTNELLALYIKFNQEAEENPELKELAKAEFKKLEGGDPDNVLIWQWVKKISLVELEAEYKKLGVHFDRYMFESEFAESGKEIVMEGLRRKIFIEGEKNAIVAEFNEENLPSTVVQKGDGTTLYLTRDLAAMRARNALGNFEKLIYVVGATQSLHFKQLFALAKKLNLSQAELVHVPFGLMKSKDGKMSTRQGEIVFAADLLKEADEQVEKLIQERNVEMPEKELKKLKAGLAYGAVKHVFVCQNPETDILFSWEKVLSFEGNSAPYLQYAYSRTASILRKFETLEPEADKDQTDLFSIHDVRKQAEEADATPFSSEHELNLLKEVIKLPQIIKASIKNNRPNIVTNYLFELSQTFNSFYQEIEVLKTKNKDLLSSRIKLVKATNQVLKNGFEILGIPYFEKM